MEKLFSYGTLQLEHVQQKTFGRKLVGQVEVLIGYRLGEVTIKDAVVVKTSGIAIHPILQYTGNPVDEVKGTIFDITPAELNQADDYEVDEYVRVVANFKSGTSAWAYVCAATESTK